VTEMTHVVCDGCGVDLTYTGNSVDYRLVLANERMPRDPGLNVVTDMAIPRPIEQAAHFCGMGCLHHWLSRTHPGAPEQYARSMRHKAFLQEVKNR